MSSLPSELQGMSVLSAGQLGRWAATSRRAFAMHARNGCGSDPAVLMVELLCSANSRLGQLSCRETDAPGNERGINATGSESANESATSPKVGGTSDE